MRLSRFVLIGGLCALLSNVLVITFTHFGFGYLVASCLAFGPVLLVGYLLHTSVTFETSASPLLFARYALAMAANFPLWIAALYLFCDVLNVPVAIAAPTTTALIFLWNYTSTKWALLSSADPAHPTVNTGD
jgi:putative flippase GtrA